MTKFKPGDVIRRRVAHDHTHKVIAVYRNRLWVSDPDGLSEPWTVFTSDFDLAPPPVWEVGKSYQRSDFGGRVYHVVHVLDDGTAVAWFGLAPDRRGMVLDKPVRALYVEVPNA